MLLDFQPRIKEGYQQAIEGLHKSVKQLPSKFFYDERGSQLFDQICNLPEYYPTRVEQAIMDNNINEIAPEKPSTQLSPTDPPAFSTAAERCGLSTVARSHISAWTPIPTSPASNAMRMAILRAACSTWTAGCAIT